jgi:branched-chain amino acid transport system substrate-binding protein
MRRLAPVVLVLAAIAVGTGVWWWTTRPPPSDMLRIGCITALTGDGAAYGIAEQRGLAVAAEEINQAGGIDGKHIRVLCEDDQLNPSAGLDAMRKLIDADKVPVIIGAGGSSVTLALAPIAERTKVVLFSPSSTADAIRDAGDYVFRNVPSNNTQGDSAAAFARKHLKANNAAIFQMNNDYGLSLGSSFKAAFEAGGGQIVSVAPYDAGTADFRGELAKIRDLAPDVVFFPGYVEDSGLILKQARELGIKSTFIGGDGAYSPTLIKIAGPAAEGSYYTVMVMAVGSADQKIERFIAAYKAKYGAAPQLSSAYAYDALLTIAEAIRRGGYSGEGIRNALYQISFDGITGTTRFDRFGDVDKPWGVYEVKNGTFVLKAW